MTPPQPRDRDDFRIAIICALSLEAEMVQFVFDKDWADEDIDFGQSDGDQNAYTIGVIGKHNVVLAYMPGMGGNNAAAVAAGLRSSYHRIDVAFVVGICGVTPKHPVTKDDIVLGDCVVSTTVIQYDFGRQYPGQFKRKTGIEDTLGKANTSIRTSITKLQTAPNLKRLSSKLQHHLAALQKEAPNSQYPGCEADWLFKESYIHEHRDEAKKCDQCENDSGVCKQDCSALGCDDSERVKRDRLQSNGDKNLVTCPRLHFGRYGSANAVMKSGKHRQRLVKEDEIVAFEMEGAGVWDNLPTIIVKSACDYADSHKNKNWQRYAAATAAAGLKSILEQWRVLDIAQGSDQIIHTMNAGHDISEAIREADELIRNYYRSSDRLQIKRLSGRELELEKCYINLALIDRSKDTRDKEQKISFSLEARLRLDASKVDQSVSLANLFDSRKLADGKTVNPRRIFIQGRAGIGKTTLCKKIVHEFLEGRLCSTLFDRLLWIPLRGLKSNREEYEWQELLRDTFKFVNRKWNVVGEEYIKQFESPKFLSRTLFLFDGLDEISYRWTEEEPLYHFINTIIRDIPNIIITSRPQANTFSLDRFDLDLETVGFTVDQVSTYIKNCVKDAERITKMEEVMAKKPLIRGLLRIPVQVDAFCYVWNGDASDAFSNQDSITMTTLYSSIIIELCKKDLRLLEKLDQRQPPSSEIEGRLREELALLGEIAFQGLLNGIAEFKPQYWNKLGNYLYESSTEFSTIFSSTLDRLSFLRTSDHDSDYTKRTYHFIHLTYQEFFAARHFTERWQHNKSLTCLRLTDRGKPDSKTPLAFLREEKYNPRYNIFWRFVTGLLSERHDVVTFFQYLYDEPKDLLGATHLRLIMYCLSEVIIYSDVHDLYTQELCQLRQGLVQEYHNTGNVRLGAEVEFPESILINFLESDELPYTETLSVLRQRPVIQEQTIDAVARKLISDYTSEVQLKAAEALWSHSTICSQPILERATNALIAAIKGSDSEVRSSAAFALRRQSSLSEAAINALIAALKDEDWDVRSSAASALGGQEAAIHDLIAALKDEDWHVRSSAAEALGGQSSLSEASINALIAALKDEASYVRRFAASALGGQSSLSEAAISLLIAALKDEDWYVRSSAASALEGQEAAIHDLIAALKDEDSGVRSFAASALEGQEAAIHDLIAALKDEDSDVRSSAASALGGQSSLSEAAISLLIAALKDEDSEVRRSAASALGRQSSLSKAGISLLIAALKDEDSEVRRSAAFALERQSSLSEAAISVLVSMPDRDEYYVQDILRKQPHFYSMIESLDIQAWRHIWSFWLKRGAHNDVSCFEFADALYVWSDGTRHKIFTNTTRIAQFREVVLSTADDLLNNNIVNTPRVIVEKDVLLEKASTAQTPQSQARDRDKPQRRERTFKKRKLRK